MKGGVIPPAGGRRMTQRARLLLWSSPARLLKAKLLLASCVVFAVVLIMGLAFSAAIWPHHFPVDGQPQARRGYTILINTFKRNDLLKQSVEHFASCSRVDSIHIIWSEADPPSDFLLACLRRVAHRNSRDGRIVEIEFDLNAEDSLNNRFKDIPELKTDAVLSVDDDVLFPCASVDFAFGVWQSAPAAMVGFVPRMHWLYRTSDGEEYYKYGGWWTVWWTGTYSMVLTKAAFFHRKYLGLYTNHMPAAIRDYVTKNRNCEDIAMSFLVANETASPPVWVKGAIREVGSSGISSLGSHNERRSQCVKDFAALYGRMPLVATTVKAIDGRRSWLW
ncbi:unnamed protein product [Spirodela intermedia]|uniref:Glycosyl transferase 64 domain-containing protein n=1 Tax=Spirodela intermedia TaxID=51605 RepID=A0A7I8K0X2_SPIIN|nr:unnamed protein product [Spirodela intermedia]